MDYGAGSAWKVRIRYMCTLVTTNSVRVCVLSNSQSFPVLILKRQTRLVFPFDACPCYSESSQTSQNPTEAGSTENTAHLDTYSPRWPRMLHISRQDHRRWKLQPQWKGRAPTVARLCHLEESAAWRSRRQFGWSLPERWWYPRSPGPRIVQSEDWPS